MGAAQQRAQPPRGVLAAQLRRLGAQQRRQRRDLDRQVRPRQRAARVRFQQRAARASAPTALAEPPPAPRGSARRSGRPRPAVTVASPSRSSEQATPAFHRPSSWRRAARECSATMKRWAMWRTPGGRPPRRAPRRPALVSAARMALSSAGGRSCISLQEADQVPRQVVQRAARGRDVDQPEERGAQLLVGGGRPPSPWRRAPAAGGGRARGSPSASAWPMRPISGSSACPPGARVATGQSVRFAGARPGPRPDAPLRGRGVRPHLGRDRLPVRGRGARRRGPHLPRRRPSLRAGRRSRGSTGNAVYEYEVHLDGDRVWPEPDSEYPPSRFRPTPRRRRCRWCSAPAASPPPTRRPTTCPRTKTPRAARSTPCAAWPSGCWTSPSTTGPTCC